MNAPLAALVNTILRAAPLAGALAATALAPLPARAAGAHEHGVARIGIAVEAKSLSLDLEFALDDLVGFERAPRTDAERRRAAEVLALLREPARWLAPEAAAQCRAEPVTIEPSLLDARAAAAADGHAELSASVTLACARAPAALELTLFAALPRLQRIELQVAGPAGQSRQLLRRPASRVDLAPAR